VDMYQTESPCFSFTSIQNGSPCKGNIEQELRVIYLLEMTKCLTSIFGKGLP